MCSVKDSVKRMKKIKLQSWRKHLQTTYPKSVSIIYKEFSELNSKMETPMRKLKVKNSDSIKYWRGCGETNQSYFAGGNVKWYNHFVNSLAVSSKIKHALPFYPTVTLLGIYPRELKTCSHKNLYVNSYISFTHNTPK